MMDSEELDKIICEILRYNDHILHEMFTIGNHHSNSKFYFVAYRDKLWILGDSIKTTDPDVLDNLNKELFDKPIMIGKYWSMDDLFRIIINNKSSKYKTLIGYFDNDVMTIEDAYYDNLKDINLSTLVKKVCKILDPDEVKYKNHDEIDTGIGVYYHGTCSKYLKSIFKKGLDHNTTNSNHGIDVKELTKGKTFLTTNYNYARNHAKNAASMTKTDAVVLELEIANRFMLQPDYDVWRVYTNPREAAKVSKEMGVYAYSGLITRIHIPKFYIMSNSGDIPIERFQYEQWLRHDRDFVEVVADCKKIQEET